MKNAPPAARSVRTRPECGALILPPGRLDAYKRPINSFRKTIGKIRTQEDCEWLLRVMLAACLSAENFIAGGTDENEMARRNDAAAIDSLPDQFKAIRTLSSFARKHDRQSGFALSLAGFHHGRGEQDQGKKISVAFIEFLRDYQHHLPTTTRRGGPWVHRGQCANLIFQKPIDDRKRHPSVGMDLLFHLVLLLRNYTAESESFARFQPGEPMPSHGHPHYNLARDFVHVATGEKIRTPGPSLRKLIKENPGVGLCQWPSAVRA